MSSLPAHTELSLLLFLTSLIPPPPLNAEHLTQRMNEVPVLPLTDTGVLLVSRTTQLSIEQLSRRVSEAFTYEEHSLLREMGTLSATVALFFVIVIDLERCFSCQQPHFSAVVDSLVCVRGVLASVMNGLPGMRSRSLQVPRAALKLTMHADLSQESAKCSISAELAL